MPVSLMRSAVREPFQKAREAHAGLLLQRGYHEHESGNADNLTKTNHIQRLCDIPASPFYQRAYGRWLEATSDDLRFEQQVLQIESRLFIGLSGSGMLETGCALHHSYGVPYIPGSAIKGVVNNFVRRHQTFDREICDALFGAAADPEGEYSDGLAGFITFHDAWWVPDSAKKPLIAEIVTSHHPDYYGHEGETPATDCDSPIPNAQIAVQGSFLFTLEAPLGWQPLLKDMLMQALSRQGLGAKTRAGYGIFRDDIEANKRLKSAQTARKVQREKEEVKIQEAAEKAQQQAQFMAMTPERQVIATLEQDYALYLELPEASKKKEYPSFVGKLNQLIKEASSWSAADDRSSAADLLEKIHDSVGWTQSGLKKQKRESKERKRREEIAALR